MFNERCRIRHLKKKMRCILSDLGTLPGFYFVSELIGNSLINLILVGNIEK